jgi:hypothetical protein
MIVRAVFLIGAAFRWHVAKRAPALASIRWVNGMERVSLNCGVRAEAVRDVAGNAE